jgi:hypothetical protein
MKFNEVTKNHWKSECGRFSIQGFRFRTTSRGTVACSPYFNAYRYYDGGKVYVDAPSLERAIQACEDVDATFSR